MSTTKATEKRGGSDPPKKRKNSEGMGFPTTVPDGPSLLPKAARHSLIDEHHGTFHSILPFQHHEATAELGSFRRVEKTGVIYVMQRARELGFTMGAPGWANFGQGAPECGKIPGQPLRADALSLDVGHQEYAPTSGNLVFREQVANYYNNLYRADGGRSQYTAQNVCVVPGGRAGLTRIMAAMGSTNLGFMLPEYTAYAQLLDIMKRVSAIPLLHDQGPDGLISAAQLRREVRGRGLGALLVSNPCNPTGQLCEGEALREWVDIARSEDCTFIMDEFYSHYIYSHPPEENGRSVSAAQYVEDVDKDPVLIVQGLTKNFRCPGWRIGWVVGPKAMIETLASAGSFLDGGANNPLQKEGAKLLCNIDWVKADAKALQDHFREKRDFMVAGLRECGIDVPNPPLGTFYIFADLAKLPPPLNDGLVFFEEALKERVICVPGVFFDINPGNRRHISKSVFLSRVRISFGPTMEELRRGIEGLKRLLKKHVTVSE